MSDRIPVTEIFAYYSRLQFKGVGRQGESVYALRLREAERLRADPTVLVAMFAESLAEAADHYARNNSSGEDFYPPRRQLNRSSGLGSTEALGQWLTQRHSERCRVLGDDSLSFHYLDRELVATRARGVQMADGRSSAYGPRLDLLAASASSGRPIIGEVKLTNRGGSPDKDIFFALIQALAAAAYLLPASQLARLRRAAHDPEERLDADARRLDVYLLSGEPPPHSPSWFDLREHAERLAEAIVPALGEQIATIAGLELAWFAQRPPATRLRITKRFSHTSEEEDSDGRPT